MLLHGALIACKALLAAECILRTCQAVYFFVAVNVDKVVGYGLKGFAVVHGGGLEALVVVVVKEHDGLFGALTEVVDMVADVLVVEGVPVVDDTVDAVGEYKVEDGALGVLVDGADGEVMEGRNYCDIAVALESLRDYAAQYLALKVYMAVGDDHAYKYPAAHSISPFAFSRYCLLSP